MPTYTTAQPIRIDLDIAVGSARITTSERDDTVVEVRPSRPDNPEDVRAAQDTQVEFANGRLDVRTPRAGLGWGRNWSVEVAVSAPAGSRLSGHTGFGNLTVEGPLGPCSFKSGAGRLHLEETGELSLSSGAGDIAVGDVAGSASVSTGNGELSIGAIAGSASIKTANGPIHLAGVGGDARVRSANGSIVIGAAGGSLDAKTATGDVRVGSITRGSIGLNTAMGELEIGIAAGTAAQLDVRTRFGTVDQQLDAADGPAGGHAVAKIRARTGAGDIRVRRAAPATPALAPA